MGRSKARKPTRTVVFGIPSFTHSVGLEFFQSMMETVGVLVQHGVSPAFITRGGDQFIAKVRNKIAWQFITEHPHAENLFFVDDDIGWPAAKVLEFLDRPEDILVGVYPKRQDQPDWPVALMGEGGELIERDGLVRATSGPAGFMRIKRRVLEGMLAIDNEMGRVPLFKDVEKGGQTREWPGIFTAGVGPDGWFWGEDYAFCQNAQAAGFEVWCDPNIDFTHSGRKTWEGNLSGSLDVFRARAAEQRKESDAA